MQTSKTDGGWIVESWHDSCSCSLAWPVLTSTKCTVKKSVRDTKAEYSILRKKT